MALVHLKNLCSEIEKGNISSSNKFELIKFYVIDAISKGFGIVFVDFNITSDILLFTYLNVRFTLMFNQPANIATVVNLNTLSTTSMPLPDDMGIHATKDNDDAYTVHKSAKTEPICRRLMSRMWETIFTEMFHVEDEMVSMQQPQQRA
ncbi:uncharacterized protein LOC135838051 [Planococcus citri]|uniref:uncharacterized protein LOC135838051 n=1 Tax=Planococcus citri TaxID=170843 RepID=UPI0031F78B40